MRHLIPGYDPDADSMAGTCLNTGGGFLGSQAAMAHVTFAHDASLGRILGNIVRAFQHAVLAPNALVVQVSHNAGEGILFVCQNGAAVQASRIQAMMASAG